MSDDTTSWKCLIIPDYRQPELRAIVEIAQMALEALLLVKAWCRARALFDYRLIIAMLERMVAQGDGYVIAFSMSVETSQTSPDSSSTFVDDAIDVCDLLRERYASSSDLQPYVADMHQSACVGHRRAASSLEQVLRFSRELGKIAARLPRENVSEGRSHSGRSSSERSQSPTRTLTPEASAVRKANRDFALFAKRFAIFVDWWGLMEYHLHQLLNTETVYVADDPTLFAAARDEWKRVKERYKIGESKIKLLSESGRGPRNDSISSVTNPELQQRIVRKPSISSDTLTHLSRRPSNSTITTKHISGSSSSSPNLPARTRHQSLQHAKSWATSSETLRSSSPELLLKNCTSNSSLVVKSESLVPSPKTTFRDPASLSGAHAVKRFSSFQDSVPVPSAEELQARRLRKIESEEKLRNRAFQLRPIGIDSRQATDVPIPVLKAAASGDCGSLRPRPIHHNTDINNGGPTTRNQPRHARLEEPPPSILDGFQVENVSCWRQFLWTLGFRKLRKTKTKAKLG